MLAGVKVGRSVLIGPSGSSFCEKIAKNRSTMSVGGSFDLESSPAVSCAWATLLGRSRLRCAGVCGFGGNSRSDFLCVRTGAESDDGHTSESAHERVGHPAALRGVTVRDVLPGPRRSTMTYLSRSVVPRAT